MTMVKILYYGIMALCNISETLCILLLYATFLQPRQYSTKWHWIYLCAVWLCGYVISVIVPFTPFFNVIFVGLLYFAYTPLFQETLYQKLVTCCCSISFFLFQSSLLISLEFFLFGTPVSKISQYAWMLINEYIMLTVNWCIWKFFPRKEQKQNLSLFQKATILFYPVISLIMIFTLLKNLQKQTAPYLFLLILFLFAALLVHLTIAEMLQIQNEKNLKLLLSAQQAKSESEKADALLDAYTNQRKLTHEFNNHIMAVESYLDTKQYDQAANYIKHLSSTSLNHSLVVNTHNPAIDAILSQKYYSATQNGLIVLFHLCDLSTPPMETADLAVILSNLFSNAINGSAGVPNGQIQIKVENSASEFLISVQNQVAEDILITNNLPPRSSKKGFGHGFGLPNVIELAHKYDASYLIECENRQFQVTLLMNKPT